MTRETPPSADRQPLVVTLLLDRPTQERFEDERARLFPTGRTAVGAHVTLFHALPADLRPEVAAALALAAVAPPYDVEVSALLPLGRGVAYRLECPALAEVHREWQRAWRDRLTRQDAQPLRLHVTVQNKVEPEVARRTLAGLAEDFRPWRTTGVALELWRYDGGPWTHLDRFDLRGSADGD